MEKKSQHDLWKVCGCFKVVENVRQYWVAQVYFASLACKELPYEMESLTAQQWLTITRQTSSCSISMLFRKHTHSLKRLIKAILLCCFAYSIHDMFYELCTTAYCTCDRNTLKNIRWMQRSNIWLHWLLTLEQHRAFQQETCNLFSRLMGNQRNNIKDWETWALKQVRKHLCPSWRGKTGFSEL